MDYNKDDWLAYHIAKIAVVAFRKVEEMTMIINSWVKMEGNAVLVAGVENRVN